MSKQADNTTPQGQPQDIIGGGIDSGVISQLIEREKLISSKLKTKEHLLFFNGNGAWARMVSSINTIDQKAAEDLVVGKKTITEVVGSSLLAEKNILMGGVFSQDSGLQGGVDFKKYHSPISLGGKGYLDNQKQATADSKTNAYHNYEGIGFRPSPGLESVEVKSKGTYGTLRAADVNFKVYTLEDLEVMQKLFLRPGYTVLLEWGHSQQLNSNQAKGSINSNITTYKNFFKDIAGDQTSDVMQVHEKALQKIAFDADYNYDSMVGYISNFNWSLDSVGGYDCSVKIIAKGSILESIKVTFDPSQTLPANEMSSNETNKGKEERKSIYHKFFSELEKTTGGNSQAAANLAANAGNLAAAAAAVTNPVVATTAGIVNFAINARGAENWGAVKDLLVEDIKKVGGVVVDAAKSVDQAGQATEDLLFGSKAESFSKMNTVSSIEGRFAMENEGFRKRLNKLKQGDKFTIPGTFYDSTYSFEGIEERDAVTGGGFTALEEEELVYYLDNNFSRYGFKFEEGNVTSRAIAGNYDAVIITARNGKIFKCAVDKTLIAESRRDSAAIVDFITENAYLETSELTEEQKKIREQLEILEKAYKESLKQQEKINKENNVDSTALQPEGDVIPVITNENFALNTALHLKNNLNSFAAFRIKDLEAKDTGVLDNDNLNEFWIPLYTLLDIYNNYVTLVDGTKVQRKGSNTPGRKLTQFYTGFQDKTIGGSYEKRLKYISAPFHFSINPMVCILPSPPTSTVLKDSKGNKLKWPDGSTAYPMGQIYKNGFHSQVQSAFTSGIMRGSPDDILNILVSGQFIIDELNKIANQAEDSDQNENNNVVYFIKTLLKGMNDAMGGINDLDLFYDEPDDLYYIVDRKVTPALRKLIPTLSLSGLKSTMTNVNISSQISNRIGNMVSIAAQGVGDKTQENISVLLKWNAGLIDRNVRHKADTNDPDEVKEERDNPEDERLKAWIKDYYDYWYEFNGSKWFDNGDYNKEIVTSLSNYHKKFCQKFVVTAYQKGKDNTPLPPPGTIPVELSFDTIGLGGLKIGQAFMIEPGLLPLNYAKDFGYIITKLEHKIADSKWITTVGTQFYSIKPPTKEELAYFEKIMADTQEFKYPEGSDPTSGGTPGPAVPYNPNDAKLPGDGSVIIKGGSFSKLGKRSDPIQQKLMDALEYAAKATGTTFKITSAGNRPLVNGGAPKRKAILAGNGVKDVNSIGSARHDGGWGVDGHILDNNGKKIAIWEGGDIAQTFIRKVREKGVSGVGLGQYYMSGTAIHLDMAAGNSVYGSVYSAFAAGKGDKGKITPSFLKPLMKATRNNINRPSGTAPNGETFKVSGP